MPNVVNLVDLTPVARYDVNPWVSVSIGEAATSAGPFNAIATIALTPVDSDPTQPASRSFTTSAAQLSSGFYQVTFLDASGGQQVLAPISYPPVDSVELVYCSVMDVQSRTPIRQLTAASKPTIAQVQSFIEDAAAEINGILTNKGYEVPIDPVASPAAYAAVHKANVDGAWAMMENAAPTSDNRAAAQSAWDGTRKMLSDEDLVLDAPQDVERAGPRGPWLTATPTGRTFNPSRGRRGVTPWNSPRDPYFSREQEY